MKIHIVSDVHTEIGFPMPPTTCADTIICAGDMGLIEKPNSLEKYFDEIQQNCDDLIYVLGNHEFYHGNYAEILEKAKKLADARGIHLLDEALGTDNLVLHGVTFWGSTLWTDLNKNDWFAKKKISSGLNDFYLIMDGDDIFTAAKTAEINARTREKINWDADVIISHHCPVVTKHRRFPINDITYGFCNTGLDQQIIDSTVKYWVFGHTHDSILLDLNGTKVISNQQGYPMSATQSGVQYEPCFFDPKLIIEV